MKTKWIVTAAIILSLLGSNFAYAQPGRDNHRGPSHHSVVNRKPDHRPRAYQPPRQTRPPHNYSHYKLSQYRPTPHGDLRPGYVVPKYYNTRPYYVADWRRHNLYEPPRGHRWLQINGDYVLAAIAGGIVTHILMGH
jgi:Predicted integral membrane protein